MFQTHSYSVLRVISLPVSSLPCLNDVEKENELIPRYETIGGLLFDTKYAWTANGPCLTISNCKTGNKVAAWSFGLIVKDYSTKIVCVKELSRRSGKLPLLVVGLESDIIGGIICIFDISGSRVLRTIQINNKITSLHIIDASYDKCPLPGPLRAFDGILAVGTVGGSVLLLDMCRHTYDEVLSGSGLDDIRDEVNACFIKTLLPGDIFSLELHKQAAMTNAEHLSINLNAAESKAAPYFILKGPKGDDRVHVNKVEVIVSALHYCPQLGSLLVGYNFGAWQLWNLINLRLVYTSPVLEENIPVSHFAIQEPCDDPRAFCYIWVVYSNTVLHQAGFPVAVLYSLNYDTKELHEGYGILYQDLTSCAVRFQMDLTLVDKQERDDNRQGAQCLSLQAIKKTISKGGLLQEHQEETLTLCSITWSAWSSKSNNTTETYMCLFDLNQWYKEQMPNSPNLKHCTYMTYISLSNVLKKVKPEYVPFLNVQVDVNTLSQFFGSQKLEEHYYPSSLAFQLCCLRENDIVICNNQGNQRALLSRLESGGAAALLNPSEIFQQSLQLGLFPLFVDLPTNLTLEDQREFLLSIALEQQLLGWLCRCATSWSCGSHAAAGCTLQFILNWGWQRALVLKENANLLSTPLFDHSGIRLDANTHRTLSHSARQLKNLSTLFGYVLRRCLNILLYPDVIKQQWESLQMVSVHLEVLQWLLNVGLLPECPVSSYPRVDEFNRISAPYPVDNLMSYYNERRVTLQRLNKEQFSTNGSLLFIDNLIELDCGGQKLQKQWENDGGTGLYPPPSLQALLRSYLTEDVDIAFKHCVVVYVFLDLAMTLDQNRYKQIITNLIKFPAVFQLSPSIIKITQAFWQLDHGDFATAMEQLLDPLVCTDDLKMWHHRVALKALLAQNQHNYALMYLQVRKPAMSDVQDLCTLISLYVANNMEDEAFHFQRQHKSLKNETTLLQHFFKECDKKGKISSLLFLTLTPAEEKHFLKYLDDVEHPNRRNLQIFYYIQRSQYIDAFELKDKFKSNAAPHRGLRGQQNVDFCDILIKDLLDTLPDVSKSLMNFCQKEKYKFWKEVQRPEPLSVFVHNLQEQAKYKSTVIHAVLSKAKETWYQPTFDKNDTFDTTITEQTPFLNTPKAGPIQSRKTTSIIFPKLMYMNEARDDYGPSPAKRLKPSPPLSIISPGLPVTSPLRTINLRVRGINMDLTCNNLSVKLDTPIIKRKVARRPSMLRLSDETFNLDTPQSILKVNVPAQDQEQLNDEPENIEMITRISNASSSGTHEATTAVSKLHLHTRRSFGITPRKPLPGSSRYAVRFDISRGSSESSVTSNTSEPSFEIVHDHAIVHSSNDGLEKVDSKNNSLSTDEVYYSPEVSLRSNNDQSTSINESGSLILGNESKVLEEVGIDIDNTNLAGNYNRNSPRTRSSSKGRGDDSNMDEILNIEESTSVKINETSSPKTPRSRRSYKGCVPEAGIRSSPRLKKSLVSNETQPEDKKLLDLIPRREKSTTKANANKIVEEIQNHSPAKAESPVKSQVRGRRALTCKVFAGDTVLEAPPQLLSRQSTSNDVAQIEVAYLKIEKTMESIHSPKASKELSQIVKEKTETTSSKETHEKSKTVTTKRRLSIESGDMDFSYGTFDYISNPFIETSKNALKIVSPKDVEKEVCDQAIPSTSKSAEGIFDNLDENIYNISNDNKISCDSDTDTVLLENDSITDTMDLYEDLSNDNKYGNADPQMNVFEISDDLDLNKSVCVSDKVEILEIDTNYGSANEDDVFADNSEVLSNVVAVNENSVKSNNSELDDCNTNIEDSNDVNSNFTSSSSATEQEKMHNVDIIEVDSSDDDEEEEGERTSNTYSESSESNGSSSQNFEDENSDESTTLPILDEGFEASSQYRENLSETQYSNDESNSVVSVSNHEEEATIEDEEPEELSEESTSVEEVLADNVAYLDSIPEETSDDESSKPQESEIEEFDDDTLNNALLLVSEDISKEQFTDGCAEESKTSLDDAKLSTIMEENRSEFMDITESMNITCENSTEISQSNILDKAVILETSYDTLNSVNESDLLDKTISSKSELSSSTNIMDLAMNSSELENIQNETSVEVPEAVKTPVRRSVRLSSFQLTPTSDQVVLRQRTRRSSSLSSLTAMEIIPQSSTSKDSPANLIRNLKSASFTAITSSPASCTRKRSSSVDIQIESAKHSNIEESPSQKSTRNRRARSVTVELPVIKEEIKKQKRNHEDDKDKIEKTEESEKKALEINLSKSSKSETKGKPSTKQTKKSKSVAGDTSTKNKIEEYSTARRITRRQASLLEKTLNMSNINLDPSQLEIQSYLDIASIDPIVLLDRHSFDGKVDSDEEKTIENPSLSSIPASPIGSQTSRKLRSHSSVSSVSPKSETDVSAYKKQSVKCSVSGTSSTLKLKQRSKSTDEILNLKRESSLPKLRRTRRNSKDADSASDVSVVSYTQSLVVDKPKTLRPRKRTLSESSPLDQTGSPLRRSGRQSLLVKSQLPNIVEEQQSSETGISDAREMSSQRNRRNLKRYTSAK